MTQFKHIEKLLGENINEINIVHMITKDADDMDIEEHLVESKRKYNNVLCQMKRCFHYGHETHASNKNQDFHGEREMEFSSMAFYGEGNEYWKYDIEYSFDKTNNALLVRKVKTIFDDDFNMIYIINKRIIFYDTIDSIFIRSTTTTEEDSY